MKTALAWVGGVVVVGALSWLFPPFHVVSLKMPSVELKTPESARKFWNETLLPAAGNAVAIDELLAALERNANDARKRLGRSPGLASATYFFVKGSGKVASVEKDAVIVALDGPAPLQPVELFTGFLFGNTVRDATGLLNASDFPNSQDFNDLSTELNRLVEMEIIPKLRSQAVIGKKLSFAGCIELGEGPIPSRMRIIPVRVE